MRRDQEGVSTEEYYDCLRDLASKYVDDVTGRGNSSTLCRMPSDEAFMSFAHGELDALEPCTTRERYVRSLDRMYEILDVLLRSPCPRPKEEVTYATFEKDLLLPIQIKNGISKVHLYYDSTDVTVTEEYRLIDLGTLLSTLGGLIGMFLGWSLLDMTKILCSILDKAKGVK